LAGLFQLPVTVTRPLRGRLLLRMIMLQKASRSMKVMARGNSACTMVVLGTGRVCATPRAQFNFHAGYYKYFGYWNVITPQWTYQMYHHYPDDVKAWVDAHRAMDQITLTTMRQPEVATYVPSCRERAAGDAVAPLEIRHEPL